MFFLMVLVDEKGIGQALAAVPPMALRRYLGRLPADGYSRVNGGVTATLLRVFGWNWLPFYDVVTSKW